MLAISNKLKAELVHVINRRGKETMKPNIVADNNLGMSGIDRPDQMLSYYQGLRKTVRWYKKIAFISHKFTCIMFFICLNVINDKVVRF